MRIAFLTGAVLRNNILSSRYMDEYRQDSISTFKMRLGLGAGLPGLRPIKDGFPATSGHVERAVEQNSSGRRRQGLSERFKRAVGNCDEAVDYS